MPQTIGRSALVALGLTTLAATAVVAAAIREMRWAQEELADVFVAQAQRRLAETRHRLELDLKDVEEDGLLAARLLANDHDLEPVRALFAARDYFISASIRRDVADNAARKPVTWHNAEQLNGVELLVDLRPRHVASLVLTIDLRTLVESRLPKANVDEQLFLLTPARLVIPRAGQALGLLVPSSHQASVLRLDASVSPFVGLAEERHFVLTESATLLGPEPWQLVLVARARHVTDSQGAVLTRLAIAAVGVCFCLFAAASALLVVLRRNRDVRRQLRQAELIRHLQEKTEKVLDNIPAGVVLLSEEGAVTQVNRFVRDRLLTPTLDRPIASLFADADPASVGHIEALLAKARASGGAESLLGETMELFDRPPGRGCYSLHVLPLAAATSEASWLLVIEDLTAVKGLEQQLLRAEKLASVGIIASGIAHEIGTPLGVVRARAEFLQGKVPPGTPEVAGLQIIVEQVDRISRTIQQVLDFARLKPSQRQPVRVEAICASVVELLRFQFEAKHVSVELSVPAQLPDLLANPDELQQVLINLLLNSLQASEKGVVRLAAEVDDGRLCLSVEDHGCGIPEENRHRVFDPFFTTKRRGQGTGLGLSIVTQIIRNHDADLSLESEVGRGTTVRLFWPLAEVRNAA